MRKPLNVWCLSLFLLALTPCCLVFAESAQAVDPTSNFLTEVIDLIKQFGGLPWTGKISGIVLLVIASMKVSFVKPIWAKLGGFQVLVAPFLGLLLGVISMHPFSLAGLLAYVSAGAGAVILHELLDGIKAMPGIGPMYVKAITLVEGLLSPSDSEPPAPPSEGNVANG